MTTFPTDEVRSGVESRKHKVLKVLLISLVCAALVMFALFAFG